MNWSPFTSVDTTTLPVNVVSAPLVSVETNEVVYWVQTGQIVEIVVTVEAVERVRAADVVVGCADTSEATGVSGEA